MDECKPLLAGISRRFPQEKRLELASRIDANAEAISGAWVGPGTFHVSSVTSLFCCVVQGE